MSAAKNKERSIVVLEEFLLRLNSLAVSHARYCRLSCITEFNWGLSSTCNILLNRIYYTSYHSIGG